MKIIDKTIFEPHRRPKEKADGAHAPRREDEEPRATHTHREEQEPETTNHRLQALLRKLQRNMSCPSSSRILSQRNHRPPLTKQKRKPSRGGPETDVHPSRSLKREKRGTESLALHDGQRDKPSNLRGDSELITDLGHGVHVLVSWVCLLRKND